MWASGLGVVWSVLAFLTSRGQDTAQVNLNFSIAWLGLVVSLAGLAAGYPRGG
jgi:hypothetical protein